MVTLSSSGTQTATIQMFNNDVCVQTSMPYKTREEQLRYNKEYYEKNKEREKTDRRKFYWDNKEKIQEQRRKEWAENKNGIRDRHREYRLKHWDHFLKLNNISRKKYRENNASRILKEKREKLINRKYELCDVLGSRICIKCGFSDIRAIQFDHINGKGRSLRKRPMSYYEMQYYINSPEEAKITFQVLCANCNWLKRWDNNECAKNIKLGGSV